MMRHIHKCIKCGDYTMNDVCKCSGNAINPKPPKFSLEDRYGNYRRRIKLKRETI